MRVGELTTELNNFRDIRRFIVDTMNNNGATKRDVVETLLVFEALYNDMLERGISKDKSIRVWGTRSFGDLTVSLGFEDEMFVPLEQGDHDHTEGRVMEAYGDKIEHSYHAGFNTLSIRVTRHVSKVMVYSLIALALALIVYLQMHFMLSSEMQKNILNQIVYPLERAYTNAVLMVGAPVTFFSLLRNLTDAYILAEKDSGMRKLQVGTLVTSVISALIALVAGVIIGLIIGGNGVVWTLSLADANSTPAEMIESLFPSSIFTPFETLFPVPLIMLALLTTYAFCHAGKYFDGIRRVVDACYNLFGRMLSVIVYTIPFFFFLAMLDVMLDGGVIWVVFIIVLMFVAFLSIAIVAAFYVIRLKLSGAEVMPMIRKMGPLLKENLVINSAIDAVPFNIRYCTVNFGMDRKRLEQKLPMLAQLNLDGNCFMLMLITMMFIQLTGLSVSWFDILVLVALVVFLSMGAPNQPGSMLIGMLIIINYLKAFDMIAVAIYCEVFFGSIINLINVEGDIVSIAVEEANEKKTKKQ